MWALLMGSKRANSGTSFVSLKRTDFSESVGKLFPFFSEHVNFLKNQQKRLGQNYKNVSAKKRPALERVQEDLYLQIPS